MKCTEDVLRYCVMPKVGLEKSKSPGNWRRPCFLNGEHGNRLWTHWHWGINVSSDLETNVLWESVPGWFWTMSHSLCRMTPLSPSTMKSKMRPLTMSLWCREQLRGQVLNKHTTELCTGERSLLERKLKASTQHITFCTAQRTTFKWILTLVTHLRKEGQSQLLGV